MQKTILSAYYIRVTRWLVTRLQSSPIGTNFAGYMFTKQSYWHKLRGLLFKLRRPLSFQLSRGLLLGAHWLAGSRSPDGGGESHHFTETKTQVPAACQPQPRQPHTIKLISQLQKPTRKISDTCIIDTGKRETRYRLVKIHQPIRQPHRNKRNPTNPINRDTTQSVELLKGGPLKNGTYWSKTSSTLVLLFTVRNVCIRPVD